LSLQAISEDRSVVRQAAVHHLHPSEGAVHLPLGDVRDGARGEARFEQIIVTEILADHEVLESRRGDDSDADEQTTRAELVSVGWEFGFDNWPLG
jgi:hypothetical protein